MSATVWIKYTNYKGERAWRRVLPREIKFGCNEWHKESQWLMFAIDLEKDAVRTFAMKDVHEWRNTPPEE